MSAHPMFVPQGMLGDRDAAADAGAMEQLDDVLCGFDADCWAAQQEATRHAALCQLLCEVGGSETDGKKTLRGTDGMLENPSRLDYV